MKCIRTKQIHEYNSNIIYTPYKQHKANTKKTTHTHTHPTLPHTYRNDLTHDVNEAVQFMYTTPYKYTVKTLYYKIIISKFINISF